MRRATGDYDAFLSYAWDPPTPRARTSRTRPLHELRYAMQDLGKPRTRRSDLEIFLDRSVQTPSPDLWRGILDNLDRARFLIVLCSPRAAASDGVAREVQHWLDTGRSVDDLLVVLLNGSPEEAFPAPLRRLRDAGTYDPLFVDLRWVASARDLDSRTSSRFRGDVATLLAPIRGVAKETLVDEELTVRERGIRVQRRFIVGLSVAVVVTLVLGLAAALQSGRANGQARIAESRALAAGAENQLSTRLDVAQLLAVEGFRRDDNLEARATLLRATLASPRLVRYLDAGAPITVLTASADGNTVVAGTEPAAPPVVDRGDGPARDLAGLTGRSRRRHRRDGATVAATDGSAVLVWRGDEPGAPVPLAPRTSPRRTRRPRSGCPRTAGGWSSHSGPAALRQGRAPSSTAPALCRPSSPGRLIVHRRVPVTTRPRAEPRPAYGSGFGSRPGRAGYVPLGPPEYTTSPMPSPRRRLLRLDERRRRSPCGGPTAPPTRTGPISRPRRLAACPKTSPSRPAAGSSLSPTRARSRLAHPLADGRGRRHGPLTGNAAVTGLRFLDRDRRLVSASGNAVALWDLDQLARSAPLGTDRPARRLQRLLGALTWRSAQKARSRRSLPTSTRP